MNNINNKVTFSFTILFLVALVYTAYYLFGLPDDLHNTLQLSDPSQTMAVNYILNNLKFVIGTVGSISLITIILLLRSSQSKNEDNIVYVNTSSIDKNIKVVSDEANSEDTGLGSETESRVNEIKNILKEKADTKSNLDKALSLICKQVEASQGAIYLTTEKGGKKIVRLTSSFAYHVPESQTLDFEFGEGLTGQAAKETKMIKVSSVPDGYIRIFSGLGNSTPSNMVFVPLRKGEESLGVIEISSFKPVSASEEEFINKAAQEIKDYLKTEKAPAKKS